jgi:hypothetical protein
LNEYFTNGSEHVKAYWSSGATFEEVVTGKWKYAMMAASTVTVEDKVNMKLKHMIIEVGDKAALIQFKEEKWNDMPRSLLGMYVHEFTVVKHQLQAHVSMHCAACGLRVPLYIAH